MKKTAEKPKESAPASDDLVTVIVKTPGKFKTATTGWHLAKGAEVQLPKKSALTLAEAGKVEIIG